MTHSTACAHDGRTSRSIVRFVMGAIVAASILLVGPALVGAASQSVNVRSQPNVFDAARLTVVVGDTVTWVVEPGSVHTVTSGTYNASGVHPDGLFDSGSLTPGDDFAFTFAAVGEFPYVCAIHADSGMVGRITVVESTNIGPVDGAPTDGAADDAPPTAVILALILGILILVIGGTRFLVRRRT